MFGNIADTIKEFLNEMLVGGTSFSLGKMTDMFNTSVNALSSEVAITPAEFDINLLNILKNISETVVLPIALLLITYVFVLQIIEYVTDKNKGSEFDTGNVIMLIIKTTIMILLATNAFTIALGFSDLSTWMIDKVPTSQVEITSNVTDDIIDSLKPVVVNKETGEELPELDEVEDEDTQKMFERFYRLEKSRSSETGGTGLGLAIAESIVHSHHGEIFAEKENESTLVIVVRLPAENIS